ncbi:MAG TPA: hypothetical protein VGL61_05135 [Kofleriaceae bacterium]|jgi:hypothetical protein
MRSSIAFAVLVSSAPAIASPDAAVAQASDDDSPVACTPQTDAPAPELVLDERALRWQGEVAIGNNLTSAVVDGTHVSSWPSVTLGGGLAIGRLVALATYTLTAEHYPGSTSTALATSAQPTFVDTDGVVHRVGLAGRYSILHGASGGGVLGDLWLQGDGGEEFTRWDRGGLLARPYFGISLGSQVGFASSLHRRHEMYVALRVQVAARNDLDDAAATCSAPCTEATPPERWADRSLELRVGFAWGN